jgi:hypothetical protein
MTSIVAVGAITGGINLTASEAELRKLGLLPGGYTILSEDRMEEIRLALEHERGTLPDPRSGGSLANTADLVARAGVSCGLMGIGGDDDFGRAFVSHCERAALEFLSAIVGTLNPAHLQENLVAVCHGPLPADVYQEARRRLAAARAGAAEAAAGAAQGT